LGPKVSPNTIERLSHHVGAVVVQQADQALIDFHKSYCVSQPRKTPKRLYIAADGTTLHETDGWHEAKAGVIYWETGVCREKVVMSVGLIPRRFLAGIFGLRRAVADYVRPRKSSFLVMQRRGFVMNAVSILGVRRSLLIGTTLWNIYGIVRRRFSVKTAQRRSRGSRSVKAGSGTDRHEGY
jgi:hypothetical protein